MLFIILISFVLVAYEMPPELPSSFYGQVEDGRVGQLVTTNFKGSARTFLFEGKVVYALNVNGGSDNAVVMFYINGQNVGTGVYHAGTNQNANLVYKPPVFYWRSFFWWWK